MFENDNVLKSAKDIFKNYEVYIVGGYLRDFFIEGKISNDRDLVCINNAYDLAGEMAEKIKGTFIELDSENKIYRVVLKDKINYFDISQALNNSLEEDIKRRDFTINSMFYDLNKNKLIDLTSAKSDIDNKIIRAYNFNNLIDDPLRLLRMYRFLSKTGFKIEKELNLFVSQNFNLINNVAKERINYEIIKIFEGKYTAETLLKMLEDNTLETIFPFVKEIKKVPSNSHHHLDLIHHSIETVRLIETDNPILKIAAFYHDIGKPKTWTIEPFGRHRFIGHDIVGSRIAKDELKNLKFSNKQIEYITKMIKYHIYPASLINCEDANKAFARFVKKLNKDALDVISLSKADRLSAQGKAVSREMTEKALNHLENLKNYYIKVQSIIESPKSFVDGNEIMKVLNIKPSKKVGEILDAIKELQLSGMILTKQDAIDYIKNNY